MLLVERKRTTWGPGSTHTQRPVALRLRSDPRTFVTRRVQRVRSSFKGSVSGFPCFNLPQKTVIEPGIASLGWGLRPATGPRNTGSKKYFFRTFFKFRKTFLKGNEFKMLVWRSPSPRYLWVGRGEMLMDLSSGTRNDGRCRWNWSVTKILWR